MTEFSELKGKTLISINVYGSESIEFKCSDGSKYRMFHDQECCESVTISDIVGDINDLLNSEILLAEERSNGEDVNCLLGNFLGSETFFVEEESNNESDDFGSITWTFYVLATINGYVNITWQGSSNGYYSEEVNFEQLK